MSVDKSKISKLLSDYLKDHILADGVKFSDDTPFSKIGIDSVTVIELVMQVEDVYGIEIPVHELKPENLNSIDAIAKFSMDYRDSASAKG